MNKDFNQTPLIDRGGLPVGMATPKNRLAAFILDIILIVPVVRLLQSPFRRGMIDSALLEKTVDLTHYQLLNSITFFVIFLLYHSILTFWRGQTFGKMFFHIKVVSLTGQISFLTALARSCFLLLGLFLFAVPFLTLFSHPLRRALHDRTSDTVVVGLKESAGFPNSKEKFWAMGLTIFAFLVPFLIFVSLTKMVLSPPLKKDSSLFEQKSSQFLPCEYALKEGRTTMESAIELFLARRVTQGCLNDFAQESLWKNQDIELSKFAMALSDFDRVKKSNAYMESICEESPKHRLCSFSQWLIHQVSQNSNQKRKDSLELIDEPQTEDFIKIFAASYALKNGDFALVEKWLSLVSRQTNLQSRVSQLFFHSLLGQEKWADALLVYRTHLSLQEEDIVTHLVNHSESQNWSVEKKLRILDRFSPKQPPQMTRLPASENKEKSVIEAYRQSLIEGL